MTHVSNDNLFDDIKDSVMEALHSTKCLFKKTMHGNLSLLETLQKE